MAKQRPADQSSDSTIPRLVFLVGYMIAACLIWVCLAIVVQEGFGRIYVILSILATTFVVVRYIGKVGAYGSLMLVIAVLWLVFAPRYSVWWDLVGILVSIGCVGWIARRKYRSEWVEYLLGRWEFLCSKSLLSLLGSLWVPILFFALAWLNVSLFDRLWSSPALPIGASPSGPGESTDDPRYGLALSGGGYRAALFHAGVFQALRDHNIRVSHISSVSGGSIIAGYCAIGGDPIAFLQAVKDGRFNLKRETVNMFNALRLPMPMRIVGTDSEVFWFYRYSRTDVQSEMLDRVMYRGRSLRDANESAGIRLMVCTTDLNTGDACGWIPGGCVIASMDDTTQRFPYSNVREQLSPAAFYPQPMDSFPLGGSLSGFVAASGAFPGVFNAVPVDVVPHEAGMHEALTRGPEVVRRLFLSPTRSMRLADGGIHDNTGVALLLAADRITRESPEALEGWELDAIIVSDAGAILKETSEFSHLGELMRAIDIVGAGSHGSRQYRRADGKALILVSPAMYSVRDRMFIDRAPLPQGESEAKLYKQIVDLDEAARSYLLRGVAGFVREVVEESLSEKRLQAEYWVNPPDYMGLYRKKFGTERIGSPSAERLRAQREDVMMFVEIAWALDTFSKTPTLQDQFDSDSADRLFRLGQYMVVLQLEQIRRQRRNRFPADTELRRLR